MVMENSYKDFILKDKVKLKDSYDPDCVGHIETFTGNKAVVAWDSTNCLKHMKFGRSCVSIEFVEDLELIEE